MPLLKASINLLPSGTLEVNLWNTSGPDINTTTTNNNNNSINNNNINNNACSVIFALRASHPSYFTLASGELGDGVLLPGECKSLVLEPLPDTINFNNSGSLTQASASSLAPMEFSLWGGPLQGSGSTTYNYNNNYNNNNMKDSNSSSIALSGSGEEGAGDLFSPALSDSPHKKKISQEKTKTFTELGPPLSRPSLAVMNTNNIININSQRGKSNTTDCSTPINREPPSPTSSSATDNGRQMSITYSLETPTEATNISGVGAEGEKRRERGEKNVDLVSSTKKRGVVHVMDQNDNNNNNINIKDESSISSPKGISATAAAHRYSGIGSDFDSSLRSRTNLSIYQTTSQSPKQKLFFFVYYERLGDEKECLNNAKKWLWSERCKYFVWREKLLLSMRQKGYNDISLASVLGEPVRWLNNVDVGSVKISNSKYSRKSYTRSSRKMFKKTRQGGGCIMLPFRSHYIRSSLLLQNQQQQQQQLGDLLSSGSDKVGNSNSWDRAGQGLALFALSENMQRNSANLPQHLNNNNNNNNNNRSTDRLSSSQVSFGNSILTPSPRDPFGLPTVQSSQETELEAQFLPQFPSLIPAEIRHTRTETEGTVQMLDQTICGNSNGEKPQEVKKKKKRKEEEEGEGVKRRNSNKSFTVTNNNNNNNTNNNNNNNNNNNVKKPEATQRERLGSGILDGIIGSFWGPQQPLENNLINEETTIEPPSRTPLALAAAARRCWQNRTIDGNNNNNIITDTTTTTNINNNNNTSTNNNSRSSSNSTPTLPQRIPSHRRLRTSSGRELRITQVGDAIRNIASASAPLMQTAVDGTMSTVASSAQLLAGLVRDSVDILYAVGIPVLLILSLYLLWVSFGFGGEEEDVMASAMDLFT